MIPWVNRMVHQLMPVVVVADRLAAPRGHGIRTDEPSGPARESGDDREPAAGPYLFVR